jgi:hypothetical protein
MADAFPAVVAALWASLGLAMPRGEAVLRVDGRAITLAPSLDERRVVVRGVAGRLDADEERRGEQLRRLLRENLGLLLSNRAGLRIGAEGDALAVTVEAAGPMRVDAVEDLRALIEDVIFLLELHGPTLRASGARGREAPRALAGADDGESLIFRL